MHRKSRICIHAALSAALLFQSCQGLRAGNTNEDCGRDAIRQIYDAQFPERSCLALPENVPAALLVHSHAEEWDEDGWPGGLNRRVMPETPKHKDLWPLNVWDVLGWLIGVVTLFIAAGGGIGGGGVLVPLYILCWGFQTEHAVALSNLTIAGGAFANLWCNITRRHPLADRPLIYWDMIMVMEPMTIVGAVLGGFLNKILPTWLTTVLLTALLIVMAQKLWLKARSMYRKESEAIQELAITSEPYETLGNDSHPVDSFPSDDEESLHLQPLLAASNKAILQRIMNDEGALTHQSPLYGEVKDILIAERTTVPLRTVLALSALFVWLVCTDTMKDLVACGSLAFWVLVFSILPVVGVMMAVVRRQLIYKCVIKQAVGVAPEIGDIAWTPETTVQYPLMCSGAGVIAGMFGVGGGIVKGPLMLHLGVLPEVAAATSATMILFTSCSASVVYLTFGGVKWDYAVLMMLTGFVVTTVGQMMTYHMIEKLGRRSVVVVAMAVLLTMGALIMVYEIFPALSAASSSGYFHVSRICR